MRQSVCVAFTAFAVSAAALTAVWAARVDDRPHHDLSRWIDSAALAATSHGLGQYVAAIPAAPDAGSRTEHSDVSAIHDAGTSGIDASREVSARLAGMLPKGS